MSNENPGGSNHESFIETARRLSELASKTRTVDRQLPLVHPSEVINWLDELRPLVFPGFFSTGGDPDDGICLLEKVGVLYWRLIKLLHRSVTECSWDCDRQAADCAVMQDSAHQAEVFMARLPEIASLLADDVKAAYDGDPAAKSTVEIVLSYPGIYAIFVHRVAHQFYTQGFRLLARIMSEHAHERTGIDIHPGARIGRNFFIDHGTGVVIGETCEIGDNVKIYQGVTLGALSFRVDENGHLERGTKRHPTIEDNVTIYAGATILGGNTVIGRGSVVGGNVWLTESIPPGSKVINRPQVEHRSTSPSEKL